MIVMEISQKVEKKSPQVVRMRISPERAMEWLEAANTNNRSVSEKYVQRLARDMKKGKWRLTHEAIAFDVNGVLLDGQHRLWAVVMSRVPVEMYVWQNLDPESMKVIDSGRSRSLADILNIGGENGEVRKPRLALLRAMLGGFGSAPVLSPAEASEMLRGHRSAIDFALENLPTVESANGVNTAITRAVIARAYYSVNPALLMDFCRKLTTGIVTSVDEGMIVLLRQQLQESRGNGLRSRAQRYGRVERVLAAWLKGEKLRKVYPATKELFPLPQETKKDA